MSRPAAAPSSASAIPTVTTAPPSRRVDRDGRTAIYLRSMAVRTACFIIAGMLFTMTSWTPLAWLFVVGAAVLPYLAVVHANNADQRRTTSVVTAPTRALGAAAPSQPLVGSIVDPDPRDSAAA